jgi:hypothetical protein
MRILSASILLISQGDERIDTRGPVAVATLNAK